MEARAEERLRRELAAARVQLRPLLGQLRTGGKLGEHLQPDEPPSLAALLELAQTVKALLECVVRIPHSDLHNSAWLLLLHLQFLHV